jgi:hypothetical protein
VSYSSRTSRFEFEAVSAIATRLTVVSEIENSNICVTSSASCLYFCCVPVSAKTATPIQTGLAIFDDDQRDLRTSGSLSTSPVDNDTVDYEFDT